MTSLVFDIGSILKDFLTSHLASIKLLAIFVIIYKSNYHNSSNYVPLLIAIYIYSISSKFDIITFLNHFGLSILYNMLLKKLRSITISSAIFINK